MSIVNVFAGGLLDRASDRRTDADWLAAQLASPATRVVPFFRLQPLVAPGGHAVGWLSAAEVAEFLPSQPTVFLGLDGDGIAHFALDLSAVEDAPSQDPFRSAGRFMDLRAIALRLPAGDASTLATGKALVDWHARHGFCAVCGQRTGMRMAGYMRKCDNTECNAEHFPRTDPVVIMLVMDGDRALLGRQAAWPAGRYSALAGFVEPGEALEEAVTREVWEEAGVRVEDVTYHSSQPWPFPASLMLGFTCRYAGGEPVAADGELQDIRWFGRGELRAGSLALPPRLAIARTLIDHWVDGA